MNNFIKLEVDSATSEESEILMADLSENNYYAFEQDGNCLKAYIKEEDFDKLRLNRLLPLNATYKYSIIGTKTGMKNGKTKCSP